MRHGSATRAAAKTWGLDLVCLDPHCYSPALTAVMVPEGHDSDAFRKVVLENFDMSLGMSLGKIKEQGVADIRTYRPLERSDADGDAGRSRDGSRSCQHLSRIAEAVVFRLLMDVLKGTQKWCRCQNRRSPSP